MAKKSTKKIVSHEQVKSAVEDFISQGGKIKTLPSQQFVRLKTIGGDKFGAYESLSDFQL